MKTTSIKIEGNLISPELFDGINDPVSKGQTPKDFGLQGKNLRDVISNAWSIANSQWNIYKTKLRGLDEAASGTEETRKYWIIPLLEELGYTPEFQRNADVVEGKTYMISHRDVSLSGFPIVIMGYNDSLDKRRSEGLGPRLSPHALLQEYLNVKEEYLFGIVTNGKTLRILRDSVRMVRLSYIEFDLELMMENQLFAEFAIMFRLLHASRMPKGTPDAAESLIEAYHLNAIESGSRIREHLSEQVRVFINVFGNGLIKHPANEELRSLLKNTNVSPDEFYEKILRLIYRILFLMVTEERGILFPGKEDVTNVEEFKKLSRFKELYNNFYSMSRLRRLSERKKVLDPKETDLFASLINSFRLFEDEKFGSKLGIKPLGGSIFSENGISLFVNAVLDNGTLLDCFDRLNQYYDRNRRLMIRVNYAALNVEEFGSVYEELLEYRGSFNVDAIGTVSFSLVKGDERSASGSHYTPEELVQPLIKHSLEYLIADKVKGRSGTDAANNLLTLKVCDPACGSGHVLLSAARRLAFEVAKYRTGEEQPTPLASRIAIREVISKCIYGVDKNHMAVELCKVALWLESYNPGLPLSYLDEKIKWGDSIIGLAEIEELKDGIPDEVFKSQKDDNKDICRELRQKNSRAKKERAVEGERLNLFREDWLPEYQSVLEKFKLLNDLPDESLVAIAEKEKKYNNLKFSMQNIRNAADFKTALWFIPKTRENLRALGTEEEFFGILSGGKEYTSQIAKTQGEAASRRFFHWFIEFPDAAIQGGFDLMIGNPPFLGGMKISTNFSISYLKYVTAKYESPGITDLAGYFFRRSFEVVNEIGFFAFISTNSISQGGTRIGSLEEIVNEGGKIIFAKRNVVWPGQATVTVVLLSLTKRAKFNIIRLDDKEVDRIDSHLVVAKEERKLEELNANQEMSFIGSYLNGKGFILTQEQADSIISKDEKYRKVIFPYLNGDDIANNPDGRPSRWVINFFDLEEEYCRITFPECYRILEERVKPVRTKTSADGEFKLRKAMAVRWWHYGEKRPGLYSTIKTLDEIFVATRASKYLCFSFVQTKYVYSEACVVIADSSYPMFAQLNNSFHENWAWMTGSALGGGTLRYTPSTAFECYPFPLLNEVNKKLLTTLGQELYDLREEIKLGRWIGLTETYNLFHNPDCRSGNLDKVAKLKSGVEKKLTLEQAVQKIEELRAKRVEMEKAVLEAYGWNDIDPGHDFHEVDYLPENDRIRFTISPAARREVLDRLMLLNQERRKEEEEKGLWQKKK